MADFIDLTNMKFGKLLVVQIHKKISNTQSIWECKCDCGNISYPSGGSLRNGGSRSCGCQRGLKLGQTGIKRKKKKHAKYTPHSRALKSSKPISERNQYTKRFSVKRNWALGRGYDWDLDFDAYKALVIQPCVFCNKPPALRKPLGKRLGPPAYFSTIDRIDSNLGYIIGNVQAACDICNIAKNTMSNQDYINHCKQVASFNSL